MLETPHVMVGAAIAIKIGNPILAIPLAFASHFLLDRVPHWDPHFYTETKNLGLPSKKSTVIAVIDSVTALVSGTIIALQFLPDYAKVTTILACCFMAVIPDQVKLPYYYLKVRHGLLQKWTDFERANQVNTTFIPGLLTQVATVTASLWWIFK